MCSFCVDCVLWLAEEGDEKEDGYWPEDDVNVISGLKLTSRDEPYKTERMKQLFNAHGFNLGVFNGGLIKGVRDAFNPFCVLEVIAVGSVGVVQIRAVETGLFLKVDQEGEVKTTDDARDEESVFRERLVGPHLTYLR